MITRFIDTMTVASTDKENKRKQRKKATKKSTDKDW